MATCKCYGCLSHPRLITSSINIGTLGMASPCDLLILSLHVTKATNSLIQDCQSLGVETFQQRVAARDAPHQRCRLLHAAVRESHHASYRNGLVPPLTTMQYRVDPCLFMSGSVVSVQQGVQYWHPHGFMVTILRRRSPDLQHHARPTPAPSQRSGLAQRLLHGARAIPGCSMGRWSMPQSLSGYESGK